MEARSLIIICWLFLLSAPMGAQGTLLTPAEGGEIVLENCARINNRETQFGPALLDNELIYLTRPKRGNIDPITKETYFKLFRAPLSPDGSPAYPQPFSVELNSNYNEGPVSFALENRVIYFTRTLQKAGATLEDGSGKTNLGIYSAYRAEYDWAGVRPLPFNGENFSNQHPSVTADGKRIFFASNREGGYGGYDLYFSDFRDGRWSEAINLGPEVNTEANEAFPYIHANGRLFFASKGHGGRGGYDLFMIDLSGRRWGKLINLPEPINSPDDEVGITLSPDGKFGYLVSNRSGGKGRDDIYLMRFARGFSSLQGPLIDGETLTIYDGSKSRRIVGAEVWLSQVSPAGRLPAEFYSFQRKAGQNASSLNPIVKPLGLLAAPALRSDREGSVRLELAVGKTYEIRVFRKGYSPETLRFLYTESGPSRPLVITMQPANCVRVSGRITSVADGGGIGELPLQFRPEGCPIASVATMTDITGNYEICLQPECSYLLSAGKAGYETGTLRLEASQLATNNHPRLDLSLKPEGGLPRRGTESDGAMLSLSDLSFYDNTAVLREEQSGDIDLLARLLQERPDIRLLLIAHTDGPKAPQALMQLGQQRAEALRQALLRRGFAPGRLRTVSYGNQYRLKKCSNCTAADFAANNRIEAKVIGWE
ncbi:OmpA family protein [Neolewinella agarilytica]|nr:OmpA family protein [Neolewinella agarilytica]